MLTTYRHRARAAIQRYGGEESNTAGDGFFIVFPDPAAAVRAAIDLQSAPDPIRVRMGVHCGAIARSREGHVGLAIHQAARIAAAAHGRQILASSVAVAGLSEAGDSLVIEDLGYYRLKDFPDPERIYAISAAGGAAPPLAPRGIVAVSKLPVPPTPLVGRGAELRRAKRLLTKGARLVTLAGPGGVGKTRLAFEIAYALRSSYRDGVHLVELGGTDDSSRALHVLAESLRLRQPEQQGFDVLAQLERWEALLFLDNLEQLGEAPHLVSELLARCGGVAVLATSRQRLGVRGEVLLDLDVLRAPDAIKLFIQRARDSKPGLKLDAASRAAVVGVCERLDGLPLALELAAARSNVFDPVALAARIRTDPALIASGGGDRPERHRSLEASLRWSYDLLRESEQHAFRRLSTFPGTFDEAAAVAVTGESQALQTLVALRDRSLLRAAPGRTQPRWEMLQTLRQRGLQLLVESGQARVAQDTMLAHFAEAATRLAPDLASERWSQTLERLGLDSHNLRASLALGHDSPEDFLRLAAALGWYWYRRGQFQEGRSWLLEALAKPSAALEPEAAAARTAAARLAYYQGDAVAALTESEVAAHSAKRLGDMRLHGHALIVLALARQQNSKPALETARAAVSAMRQAGDAWGRALASFYVGVVAILAGASEAAKEPLQASERLFFELGDRWGLGGAYYYLGGLAADGGDLETARKLTEESVELLRDTGDRWREAVALRGLAKIVTEQGGDPQPILDDMRRARMLLA